MTDKTIPIDDMFGEMMNWAVRYALGRRTYAVSDTCGYIKPLIPFLDNQTLSVMLQDIQAQGRIGDYGDLIDLECWMALKQALIQELEARKNDPNRRQKDFL